MLVIQLLGFEIFLVLQKFFLQRLQELEFQTKRSATSYQMIRTTPPCRYVSLTELHKALGVSWCSIGDPWFWTSSLRNITLKEACFFGGSGKTFMLFIYSIVVCIDFLPFRITVNLRVNDCDIAKEWLNFGDRLNRIPWDDTRRWLVFLQQLWMGPFHGPWISFNISLNHGYPHEIAVCKNHWYTRFQQVRKDVTGWHRSIACVWWEFLQLTRSAQCVFSNRSSEKICVKNTDQGWLESNNSAIPFP